jgi:hypothetical protein
MSSSDFDLLENWWDVLTQASEQLPGVQEALRRRKTFEGCEPFEI